MTLYRYVVSLAAALVPIGPMAAVQTSSEPPLIRHFFEMVTTIDRAPVRLEAMEIRPRGPGPFPLVVIAHGKEGGEEGRRAQRAQDMTRQAAMFAQGGYVAVVAMRRGYGASLGNYAEDDGACDAPRYVEASKAAARDITATVAAAATRPGVDRTRILVVGQSAGGTAALAMSTMPPPGVLGVISFAGGRGARPDARGTVCQTDRLLDALRQFGAAGKLPTLWVYAENDPLFRPDLARAMHRAFTDAGGKATLTMLAPVAGNGHGVFERGFDAWRPQVEAFLAQLGLPNLRRKHRPSMPVRLGINGQTAFIEYIDGPWPYRAFANSGTGRFGWSSSEQSLDNARRAALDNCQKDGSVCAIVHEQVLVEDR